MRIDPWLPVGLTLPDGARTRLPCAEGADWQIYEAEGGGRALVVRNGLLRRWVESGLISEKDWPAVPFGSNALFSYSSPRQALTPLTQSQSPNSNVEAITFARSLRATREIDPTTSLTDALYVEAISRLLPTYTSAPAVADDLLLGTWLTGGVPISVQSFQRLSTFLSWLGRSQLAEVIRDAGLESAPEAAVPVGSDAAAQRRRGPFSLAGRAELEQFFREHVIDIIENEARYRALGIEFPGAIILHGPPGCGKTFAVQQLVDYLGWPSFAVDATSIGSPYIHETSRKVAAVFDEATKSAPAVLVIDEMEAFLADRERGADTSHHRVEEVAEFLRRIPEAVKGHVLIIGMTNRMEMIDPAIQRRGRFDHVVHVDYADEIAVLSLLTNMMTGLPHESSIDLRPLASSLAGRPLSDVTFVVREGLGRRAAKDGRNALTQEDLSAALASAPPAQGAQRNRIGFI